MEEILAGHIPENQVRQLVVYRVPEIKLDAAADHWWHFPFTENLLRTITHPTTGNYLFLAVPYAKDACIFLTPTGCQFPAVKPFDCSMFPFYFRRGEYYAEKWCPLTDNCQSAVMQHKLTQAIEEYRRFNLEHRDRYFHHLPELIDRFQLQIIDFST
jgi:Fe-S-cluster containining protein